MGKVKVLQVIGTLQIGGAETIAMNFARYMNKEKFQIDYLVFGNNVGEYEVEAINLGSKVMHIESPSNGYIKYMKNLKEILINGKYDVIHTHLLSNNGLSLKVAHHLNVSKRISHSHSTNSGKKMNSIYQMYVYLMRKFIKKYATHYIACGKDAANYLYGEKISKEKGIIINNGIDVNKYSFSKEKRIKIRNEFNLKNAIVIGHIGRLSVVKNHDFLLRIFKELYLLNNNVLLLIVGDGELKTHIENKCIDLGIEDRVIMTGNRLDVADLVHAIDIFVFPSLYEGLPVAMIEAQASGAPCIVSDNITSDVKITNLVTFLSINQDPKIWANKILENVNINRINCSQELTEKGFDILESIFQLEQIYLS